jgi:NADPH2:quinone reductase
MMLKGLTAQYLLKKTLPAEGLQPGDHVLFHAAAGGVGLIACQWARALGLQLIGTAGGRPSAAGAGARRAHVIDYTKEDFVARVKEITGGKGVKVVYDSVGKDTFEGSLNCLRPFGLLASFGNASGPVPPFAPGILGTKGSLYLTRATLFTHIATREATQAMADDLFAVVRQRPGEDPHRPALPAGRGGAGAPRPGSAQDDGQYGADAVRLLPLPPGRERVQLHDYRHHHGRA